MSATDGDDRTAAAAVLMVARAVYAFNWYDIGAVPVQIEHATGAGTVEFGIVLAAFLVGAAVFQLPAGLLALRWGNRRTALAALATMGAFCLASGFAPSWPWLAVTRVGAGAGAAFFFAPGLALVTSYFPEGRRGPIIGLYNGGFSLGSAVGLIGGAVVAQAFGWGATLALGGGLLLAVVPAAVRLLPTSGQDLPSAPHDAGTPALARSIFRSRSLWALTIAGVGLWAGYYIAAQYFVEYVGAVRPGWSLAVAAAIPSVMVLVQIGSGPMGGWLAERSDDMRRWFLAGGLAAGGLLVLVPFLPLYGVAVAFLALGVAAGVTWSVLYLTPSYLPEVSPGGLSLAIALLNSVQIFAGSALALLFALIAADGGFTGAWVYAGLLCVTFLPALLWVGRVRARGYRFMSAGSGSAVVSSARPEE